MGGNDASEDFMASLQEATASDSCEDDGNSGLVVADSLEETSTSIDGDLHTCFSSFRKTEQHEKLRGNHLFNLNQLPDEAVQMENHQNDSDDLAAYAFAIVEDSFERDGHSDDDGEETTLCVERKSHLEEDLTGKKVEHADETIIHTSTVCEPKNQFDLNKFPEEGADFGYQSEALNQEVLTMLKIYFPHFY